MPRKTARTPKRTHKPDDPKQSKAFVDMAREIGADESGKEFRKALKKIAPAKRATPRGA